MNEASRLAFNRLKPHCIALSAVSLRRPDKCLIELEQLSKALDSTAQSAITQSIANYVFFPLKPLLIADIAESISVHVFHIMAWLLQTEWFIQGGEMTTQLVRLFARGLQTSKTEELRFSIYSAFNSLFSSAKQEITHLPNRPTLAFFVSTSLDEKSGVNVREKALNTLHQFYRQCDGDLAASFLPGTVSVLTRSVTRHNEKSHLITTALRVLSESITVAFNGELTDYRDSSWQAATELQLQRALEPVLQQLMEHDSDLVKLEIVALCNRLLKQTILQRQIFVLTLIYLDPQSVSQDYNAELIKFMSSNVDTIVSTLQAADEGLKVRKLKSMARAIRLLGSIMHLRFSDQIVSQVSSFLQFENTSLITIVPDDGEKLPECAIKYLSDDSTSALIGLLESCTAPQNFYCDSPELLWIGQKLGMDTCDDAVTLFTRAPDLAFQSILATAKTAGLAFRPRLCDVLYRILALSQANRSSLEQLSKYCCYQSLQEMIVDNADSIINDIQIAFWSLELTPKTPKILGMLIQLAPAMVELIDDIVVTLFKYLDDYHGHNDVVEGILTALSAVVSAVLKQQPTSAFNTVLRTIEGVKIPETSFEDRFDAADEAEAESKRFDDEAEDHDTKSYLIVLQIMQKAQLFLSHDDVSIKIGILGLLHAGIPIIAQNENKFLPLVHLYWPQLTRRLEDKNPYVVADVLRVMARTITFAGSFMRMRIKTDVIPSISDILHPPRDRRGNIVGLRREWEGTGRRRVAASVESIIMAILEDGGLVEEERVKVLTLVRDTSDRSEKMSKLLETIVSEGHGV